MHKTGKYNPRHDQEALPNREEIKTILLGDTELLVKKAEELGDLLARKKLSMSQIRNVYGVVKKLEGQKFDEIKTINELLLLKPRLAYAAARDKSVIYLRDVLSPAIELVDKDKDRFTNFCKFFEAILAYFRAKEEEYKHRRTK